MSTIERMRTHVEINQNHVSNVSSMDFPNTFPGIDDSWDFEKFKQEFSLIVSKLNDEELEFDVIGIDASLANAFRRIMIAEVPTMAIEKVFILNNTGVMDDGVLAHRLGLIPLKVDPREFQRKTHEDDATDLNTLVFKLNVACKHTQKPKGGISSNNNSTLNSDSHLAVKSNSLEWLAQGDQEERFPDGIRPVHEDILITKLRPGQAMELELHCEKGIGKDHAKFSPVATASYRILPEITILKPIIGQDAVKFQQCFPPGVIDVVENKKGQMEAVVKNPRKDTVSREVLRHPEFADSVRLSRVRNHFIFNIESVGALPSAVIFEESIKILNDKCNTLLEALDVI